MKCTTTAATTSLCGNRRMPLALLALSVIGMEAPPAAMAEEEWRLGLTLQVPFGGSQEKSFVHFANTRIGAKLQYAEIDDIVKQNRQTVERIYLGEELQSSTVTEEGVVKLKDGDKVVGGEGYITVAPFSGFWDVAGGIGAFSGSNAIQGAAGIGYDPTLGGFLSVGALLPYSQAGVRFNLRYIDYYLGLTSLPAFSPATVWREDEVAYDDTVIVPPEADEAGEVTGEGEQAPLQ
jgi:hypothetical protein